MQARAEAVHEAGRAWSEEKTEMQNEIQELREIVLKLQSESPVRSLTFTHQSIPAVAQTLILHFAVRPRLRTRSFYSNCIMTSNPA